MAKTKKVRHHCFFWNNFVSGATFHSESFAVRKCLLIAQDSERMRGRQTAGQAAPRRPESVGLHSRGGDSRAAEQAHALPNTQGTVRGDKTTCLGIPQFSKLLSILNITIVSVHLFAFNMFFKITLRNFIANQNQYDLSPHTHQDGHHNKH